MSMMMKSTGRSETLKLINCESESLLYLNTYTLVMREKHVAVGTCLDCGVSDVELFGTYDGLRCTNCAVDVSKTPQTYIPSILADDEQNEIATNLNEFVDELADIAFTLELQDGSTYTIDGLQAHAVLLESGEEWKKFLQSVASKVAEHYEKQTEPTKLAEYASWGSSGHDDSKNTYEMHAELAPVVLYQHIRNAQMQLALQGMSGDEEAPSVVGIGEDKISKYTKNNKITIEYNYEGCF